jgi:subtilisin-like proprotein convertase family protein
MRFRVLRPLLAAVALALSLAAAAPAQAALPVSSDPASPTQVIEHAGTLDGIRGPGDTLRIVHTITASGPATSLTGTLSSSTPGVSVVQATSSYPDLVNGASAPNDVAFRIQLDNAVPCGETLKLTLTVVGNQGSTQIPLRVATGAAGPYGAWNSVTVPRPIPVEGVVDSTLDVTQGGRAKGVRVRIGELDHSYMGDLRISLVAPDGTTSALLFDQSGGSLDNMRNVTFVASGGQDAGTLSPPYTNATINAPALAALDGVAALGTWTLRIDDRKFSDSGTLKAWGMDLAPATCDGAPVASFTASPNPVLPGQTLTLDASGSTDPTDPISLYEWDLDGDGQYDDATGVTTTTSYATPQRVVVGLRITAGGATATRSVPVAVSAAPVADLQPPSATVQTGTSVTLDASASSDADGIERFRFDLDGNGTFETDNGTAPTVTRSWPSAGVRTVRVEVTDIFGASSVATSTITVTNRQPTVSLAWDAPAIAGQPVTLRATAADADGTIVGHDWDLENDNVWDAFTGTSATYEHTWATAGTYAVKLRVRDNDDGFTTVVGNVVVTRAPIAAVSATPNPASIDRR